MLVSLVDTGVSANGSLMWEEAEVPEETPGIQLMKIRMVNYRNYALITHPNKYKSPPHPSPDKNVLPPVKLSTRSPKTEINNTNIIFVIPRPFYSF